MDEEKSPASITHCDDVRRTTRHWY